jgi:energy-coupling factor transporter ATP-binding protein EcfA2
MPHIDVTVECPVKKTFRVALVAGQFDLQLAKKASERFQVDVPGPEEDWRIGLIVGPSGSGKTTVARAAFGESLASSGEAWPADLAVVDGFPEGVGVKVITATLTAVGFSSPPAWCKPYSALSNGERFRCDLARALLSGRDLVVYDEFTSVVDRIVAKFGSAAVAKAIRGGNVARRFVAVTCHHDVAEWLQPDWVLDMASGQLARGCLQRPPIELSVAPVHHSAWFLFRRHHYLNTDIRPGARCFAAFWGETPVAFSAWINAMSRNRRRGDMREHRTVVLPDYQGLGIGNRLAEFAASIYVGLGGRAFSTTSHPAMIAHRSASPLWCRRRFGMANPPGATGKFRRNSKGESIAYRGTSCARITAGFRYVGPGLAADLARRYVEAVPERFMPNPSHDRVEAVIRATGGASAAYIARATGLSLTRVRIIGAELAAEGKVRRLGGGGRVDTHGWYPCEKGIS